MTATVTATVTATGPALDRHCEDHQWLQRGTNKYLTRSNNLHSLLLQWIPLAALYPDVGNPLSKHGAGSMQENGILIQLMRFMSRVRKRNMHVIANLPPE